MSVSCLLIVCELCVCESHVFPKRWSVDGLLIAKRVHTELPKMGRPTQTPVISSANLSDPSSHLHGRFFQLPGDLRPGGEGVRHSLSTAKKLLFSNTFRVSYWKILQEPQGLLLDFLLQNYFQDPVRAPLFLAHSGKEGSWKGALASTYFKGIIFGALAGISGKSPGAVIDKSCF